MVDLHLLYYTRKAKYFRVKVLSDRNDKFLKEFKPLNLIPLSVVGLCIQFVEIHLYMLTSRLIEGGICFLKLNLTDWSRQQIFYFVNTFYSTDLFLLL